MINISRFFSAKIVNGNFHENLFHNSPLRRLNWALEFWFQRFFSRCFVSDERMRVLLAQKSVGCTLRKQPADITKWFYDALIVYGNLWVRPDKDHLPVKIYIEELFGYLKFVALPNNVTRKQTLIATKWLALKEKIDQL